MTHPSAVAALEQKHAELLSKLKGFEARIERIKAEMALLEALEAQVRETSKTLAHLESSIRVFKQDWTPAPPVGLSRRPGRR